MRRLITSLLLFGLLFACSPIEESPSATERPDHVPSESPQDYTSPDQALDLREANVLQVTFEQVDAGTYLFEVTLIHDDQGESPNFADSWQVEDPSGNVLGTRVLLHAHGNQPFTRSERIDIPDDVSTVIVRGHDMLHGHGGQSMRVDLTTGAVEAFLEGDG